MSTPPQTLLEHLSRAEPVFWINPERQRLEDCRRSLALDVAAIHDASDRLARFAPLLAALFPELALTGGLIESELCDVPAYARRVHEQSGDDVAGGMFVKADHLLPVAGSIKSRGGVYAVLCLAEEIALAAGLLSGPDDAAEKLAGRAAADVFQGFTLTTGSTGNLGLSVGVMGRALGFNVVVHMSAEAKAWKKRRLRALGAMVIERAGDYSQACATARREAAGDPKTRFIDDENSQELFLGYAVAALRLKDQLAARQIPVDAEHPLFLYLPCGVGGAPGGVTFGARLVFGDHVHCFFAEPTQAPCMLLGLATGKREAVGVQDIGLAGRTEADGLAVSRPSRLAAAFMAPLADGGFTVSDEEMFLELLALRETEGFEVEPSSAAVLSGPRRLFTAPEGREYLARTGLSAVADRAVHILWTSGGALISSGRHKAFREKGRVAREASGNGS